MNKNIGDCALCETKNVQRLEVTLNGKTAFICQKHSASTQADYDEIKGTRRARIHVTRDMPLTGKKYIVYLYNRGNIKEWETNYFARSREYKTMIRATNTVRKFLDQ